MSGFFIAHDYLNAKLRKCDNINQFNKSIKLIENKSQFDKLKQTGVGQTTILKFLKTLINLLESYLIDKYNSDLIGLLEQGSSY